ncbi:alpha-L-arabinofuranosidase C-terminal domain-containing protein [Niabella beijingensis]|uniref:alpha-L-arabinofuranosidase C-terminal domain-containing protein n=1 Tax=Niabella beijingensis TaxID=2872700 RepID=UPI001CBCAE28|nr:alpha-L-arabinofuranosidase C-terminal domain-containing protein [Niabella beijingensis]MBZ4192203.1 carbohydrate binding domain-containing protein [Niabella beijingensis]
MKRIFLLFLAAVLFGSTCVADEPDSVYIFSYARAQDEGRSGLLFAWSRDQQNWHPVGNGFGFVKSDYGRWGSEKRMIRPFLFYDADDLWHCIWNLDNKEGAVAYTSSKDLLYWMPQSYFISQKALKRFTPEKMNAERSRQQQIVIAGAAETGVIKKVPWNIVSGLIKKEQLSGYRSRLWGETTKEDARRFAGLKPLKLVISPEPAGAKKISNLLMGVFFEDINYAADGGLYAELIQNRDFEYAPSDKENRDPAWNSKKAWSLSGNGAEFTIDSVHPVHPNNKNYAVLKTAGGQTGVINEGFDGIAVTAGERYDFSLFVRSMSGKKKALAIRLIGRQGEELAAASVKEPTGEWQQLRTVLIARKTAAGARLEIVLQPESVIAIDMVSLFPQKTFRARKNGLRADLAASIADLHPRFVRFPGGCVAHGDGLENIYHWKNTIGPLEARKPQRNLWGYHQTAGLGYFEYFQFCEDIGAAPLPVVAAGVPCQNSARHGHPLGGQQGGIPLDEMDRYIQDVLDLIEWANGSAQTKWGSLRAAAGHPEPFNLKYIGIGNEDLISEVFTERFTLIYKAVKEKYPAITIIGTAGPFFEGADYTEGWKLATKLGVPMIDEHYYVPPAWFIYNQDFYDKYDRAGPRVYLGEYAAHLPDRPNNLETALAEAIHLTALERNGDVVHMASYAPLLAKENHTQWNPDLIYFNNTTIKRTTGYYIQQLFGQNAGDEYIPAKAMYSDNNEKVKNRVAWSIVRNSHTKELIIKMVNLLPVPATLSLDMDSFRFSNPTIIKTVLKGRPDEKDLVPVQTAVVINEIRTIELAPYSFTVLRIKP